MKTDNISDDDVLYGLMGGAFFVLLCLAGSLAAWNDGTPSPLMTFLGYANWFFPTDPYPIKRYLLSRPWHIVPLAISAISFLLILKTLITGKCAFLKGVTFGQVVSLNFVVTVMFITPMCVETIIILGLSAGAIIGIIITLVAMVEWVNNRFNNACNCTVVANTINDENVNKESRSSIETAKIKIPYYSAKKYRQGR